MSCWSFPDDDQSRTGKYIDMKQIIAIALLLMLVTLTGCEVIGAIFNAGIYTGIAMVLLVIAIMIWAIVRLSRRK